MSPKGYNQAYINACYSILDRRFTDPVIQPGRKRNEYATFCQMVDAAGPAQPTVLRLSISATEAMRRITILHMP